MNSEVYYILKVMPNDTLIWYELSADGQILNQLSATNFSELPAITAKDKLIVLLPGQWFFMTRVTLPKASKQNSLKAVPFLVEEKLAGNVDELHLVVEKKANDEYLVVGIEHSKIAEIHAELRSRNYTPLALLPDFIALAYNPDAWTLFLNEGVAIMRVGAEEGFSLPEQQLPLALRLKAKQIDSDTLQRVNVSIKSVRTDLRALLDKESNFEFKVMEQVHPFDLNLFQQKVPFNLLQGKYRLKAAKNLKREYWRYAGVACCAWLGFLVVGNLGLWAYFSHQHSKVQSQIATLYQTLFPGQAMSDPQEMMNHEFSVHQSNAREDNLVVILSDVGQALAQFNSLDLKSISYEDNELTLTVSASKLSELSSFSTALENHQLVIKQNQVDTGAKEVAASIKVARKGS